MSHHSSSNNSIGYVRLIYQLRFLHLVSPPLFCSIYSLITFFLLLFISNFYYYISIIYISSNNITLQKQLQQKMLGAVDILFAFIFLILSPLFFQFISLLTFCSKTIISIHFDSMEFHLYLYLSREFSRKVFTKEYCRQFFQHLCFFFKRWGQY